MSDLTTVWEAYKSDAQECICALTELGALNGALKAFGSCDLVGKTQVMLSREEKHVIIAGGYIHG